MYLGDADCKCPGSAVPRGALRARRLGGLGAGVTTASSAGGGYIGTPEEYMGTGCPSGMIAVGAAYRDKTGTNWNIKCARPAPPPPVVRQPPPAPVINVAPVTTVSPNIQTQVTPQISPVFQQSSGSGALTAGGASQQTGAQSGAGGSAPGGSSAGAGISAQELQKILAEQETLRQQADQRAREEQQRLLAQQAASAAAQQEQMLKTLADQDAAARAKLQEDMERARQEAAEAAAAAAAAAPKVTQTPVIIPAGTPSPPIFDTAAPAPIAPAEPLKKPINVYMVGGAVLLIIAGAVYYMGKKRKRK